MLTMNVVTMKNSHMQHYTQEMSTQRLGSNRETCHGNRHLNLTRYHFSCHAWLSTSIACEDYTSHVFHNQASEDTWLCAPIAASVAVRVVLAFHTARCRSLNTDNEKATPTEPLRLRASGVFLHSNTPSLALR